MSLRANRVKQREGERERERGGQREREREREREKRTEIENKLRALLVGSTGYEPLAEFPPRGGSTGLIREII